MSNVYRVYAPGRGVDVFDVITDGDKDEAIEIAHRGDGDFVEGGLDHYDPPEEWYAELIDTYDDYVED